MYSLKADPVSKSTRRLSRCVELGVKLYVEPNGSSEQTNEVRKYLTTSVFRECRETVLKWLKSHGGVEVMKLTKIDDGEKSSDKSERSGR